MHSNDVPAMALRASVFLTTRMYTPAARAFERSSVICDTRQAAVLGSDHGQRRRRHRTDLGHQRLLIFQVKSHSNLLALKITLRPTTCGLAPTRKAPCGAAHP